METQVNPGEGEKEGQRKVFLRLEVPAEEPRIAQEQACLSICPAKLSQGLGAACGTCGLTPTPLGSEPGIGASGSPAPPQ